MFDIGPNSYADNGKEKLLVDHGSPLKFCLHTKSALR